MDIDDHEILIEKGLELYDAFKYESAYPFLEKAYKLNPNCMCAMYNYANVLHQLERHEDAYDVLLKLISMNPEKAKEYCPEIKSPRGFIIDAHYLIFLVMIYGQGFSQEAFNYAERHLVLRARGVESVFSKKEIQKEINKYKNEWKKCITR